MRYHLHDTGGRTEIDEPSVGRSGDGAIRSFHGGPVQRRRQLRVAERETIATADAHTVAVLYAFCLAIRDQLVRRENGRIGFFCKRDDITEMIAMAMRNEDVIRLLHIFH